MNGAPLRVSPVDRLDRSLVVAQAQTVEEDEIRAYARLVERLMSVTGGVRSLGSPALTLCAIAAGRLEAYCEYAMDPWDIAAGQLILEQAGGRLTLFDGSSASLNHLLIFRTDYRTSTTPVDPHLIERARVLFLSRDIRPLWVNRVAGFCCQPPEGAFYAWVEITGTGRSAEDLCRVLLEDAGAFVLMLLRSLSGGGRGDLLCWVGSIALRCSVHERGKCQGDENGEKPKWHGVKERLTT